MAKEKIKKTKEEYAKEIAKSKKKLADEIIKNIKENNGLKWLKEWVSNGPQNVLNSETKYKGINFVRLVCDMNSKGSKDPRYMTMIQANKAGYKIKKGAKSISCEHWSFVSSKKVKDKDDEDVIININRKVPVITYFKLFHASDVEGLPKFEKIKTNTLKGEFKKMVDKLVETSSCPITFDSIDKACYNSFLDFISLPPKNMFKTKEGAISTLLHEMSHSTGHNSRLNRQLGNKFGSLDYAKEELIAELSSIFSQVELNIELKTEHIDNHSAYLKSWLKVLKDDYNEIFKAIGLAESSTSYIMKRYKGEAKEKLVIAVKGNEVIETPAPF